MHYYGPLVRAPAGQIWRWRTTKTVAHLVNFYPLRQKSHGVYSMCGRRVRGTWSAFQVGGYSNKPCGDCVGLLPRVGS